GAARAASVARAASPPVARGAGRVAARAAPAAGPARAARRSSPRPSGAGPAWTGGAPLVPAPVWGWTGVVGTGQSLAVGGHGNAPAMTIGATTQPFHNLKLSLGSVTVPPWNASA